jgi:hypothetical protein
MRGEMPELSWWQRILSAMLGPAVLGAWWYFAPDYSAFLSSRLSELSMGEIISKVGYFGVLILLLRAAISWTCEADRT